MIVSVFRGFTAIASNSRTEMRQTTERNRANSPNGNVPINRMALTLPMGYSSITDVKHEEAYKNRILDAVLERKLAGVGAVLVEGPNRLRAQPREIIGVPVFPVGKW